MRSSVRPTAPSVEFSTGTTAYSVCPLSTARKISSNVGNGTASTCVPKCFATAAWLNVPAGPR